MAINQRPNVDAAFLAGRVPFYENLYVVGPFAARVSFASQQRRALNLIWAINEDFQRAGVPAGLEGKKVAVVGVGLAGATCAVALLAFKSVVWTFEKQPDMMFGMAETTHRDIHPTVNFWPQETLEPSTLLPFFNWCQNSCKEVLKVVQGEWDKFRTKIKRVRYERPVLGIEPVGSKWRLKVEPSPVDRTSIPDFDIVIFATGFGPERDLDKYKTPGYWDTTRDRISRIQEAKQSPCEKYIVSGTGDGGIIEVLRLLFKDFRAGSIELNTASLFDDPDLQAKIKAIETAAQRKMQDAALHKGVPPDKKGFPVGEDELNRISDFLWERYHALLEEDAISAATVECLEREHKKSVVDKVILVGQRTSPLELSVSPYHRVLLAYAIWRGHVQYFQVEGEMVAADCTERGGHIDEAERLDIPRRRISFNALRHLYFNDAGQMTSETFTSPRHEKYTAAFYVSRHGYDSPLPKLLESLDPKLSGYIRRQQLLYAEQDWLTDAQADLYADLLGETLPSKKHDFAYVHYGIANSFFQRCHGVGVMPVEPPEITQTTEKKDNAKFVLIKPTKPADVDLLMRTRSFIPERFLGVTVDRGATVAIRRADRTGHVP